MGKFPFSPESHFFAPPEKSSGSSQKPKKRTKKRATESIRTFADILSSIPPTHQLVQAYQNLESAGIESELRERIYFMVRNNFLRMLRTLVFLHKLEHGTSSAPTRDTLTLFALTFGAPHQLLYNIAPSLARQHWLGSPLDPSLPIKQVLEMLSAWEHADPRLKESAEYKERVEATEHLTQAMAQLREEGDAIYQNLLHTLQVVFQTIPQEKERAAVERAIAQVIRNLEECSHNLEHLAVKEISLLHKARRFSLFEVLRRDLAFFRITARPFLLFLSIEGEERVYPGVLAALRSDPHHTRPTEEEERYTVCFAAPFISETPPTEGLSQWHVFTFPFVRSATKGKKAGALESSLVGKRVAFSGSASFQHNLLTALTKEEKPSSRKTQTEKTKLLFSKEHRQLIANRLKELLYSESRFPEALENNLYRASELVRRLSDFTFSLHIFVADQESLKNLLQLRYATDNPHRSIKDAALHDLTAFATALRTAILAEGIAIAKTIVKGGREPEHLLLDEKTVRATLHLRKNNQAFIERFSRFLEKLYELHKKGDSRTSKTIDKKQ